MSRYAFQKRNTFMNSIDPVSKIIWLLCVSILALSINMVIPQLTNLAAVLVVTFVLGRTSINDFWLRTRFFFFVSTSYFFIQMLVVPGSSVLASIGPITFTWEALEVAGSTSMRIFILIIISLVFTKSTSPRDLALALNQKLHLNYVISFMVFIGLRYLPLVEEIYSNIKEAQMVRGVGEKPGIMGKFRNLKRYSVPLLATVLERGRITAFALDSKGFRAYPTRTNTYIIVIPIAGKIFSVVWILLTLSWFAAILIFNWHAPTLESLLSGK